MHGRMWAVLACAAVAWAGLAWGAEAQKEVYLAPDPETQQLERGQQIGNPIPLTGFIAALGITASAALLAPALPARTGLKERVLRRHLPLVLLLLACYIAINLLQTGYPQVYTGEIGNRPGTPSIRLPYIVGLSLLLSDSAILPGGLVAPLALVLGCIIACAWAVAVLLRGGSAPGPVRLTMSRLAHRQLGAVALALPFLLTAVWSAVRLLVALPPDAAARPYLFVLPLAALALLGLAGLSLAKAFHVARAAAHPRLGAAAGEAWLGLGRVETGLAGLVLLLALAGTLLPNVPAASQLLVDPAFGAFGLSLRSFTGFLAALAIPLSPLALVHFQGAQALARPLAGEPEPGVRRSWWMLAVGGGAALVASGLAAFGLLGPLDEGALRGWVVCAAPLVPALFAIRPRPAALPAICTAIVLWGMGNTYRLTYQPNASAIPDFAVPPGALMLWNLAAASLAATAIARVARQAALERGARAGAAATGLAVALVLLAILEMPLSAWVISDIHGQTLAVGSAIASQDGSVRAVMHTLAAAASVLGAWLLARMLRPEWFGRRPPAAVRAPAAPQPARLMTEALRE